MSRGIRGKRRPAHGRGNLGIGHPGAQQPVVVLGIPAAYARIHEGDVKHSQGARRFQLIQLMLHYEIAGNGIPVTGRSIGPGSVRPVLRYSQLLFSAGIRNIANLSQGIHKLG